MAQYVTRKNLAAAFAEWDRRYREDPEGFDESWHESSTATEYGDRAADYLMSVLRSQGTLATLAPETASRLVYSPPEVGR